METYYYETKKRGHQCFNFKSDQEAIKSITKKYGKELEIIYKESPTKDGTPFIVIWEQK